MWVGWPVWGSISLLTLLSGERLNMEGMQVGNSLFRQKILAFTLIQVALLSFLLVVSVVIRIMLYPHHYLEALPLYFIVGFFFLWEMLDFLLVSKELEASGGKLQSSFVVRAVLRLFVSLAAGFFISAFLSAQFQFTAVIFLVFLVAEYVFDFIFYRQVLRK